MKTFMLISSIFLLTSCVRAKSYPYRHVIKDRAITFTNCTIEDVKNVREYHFQPEDVIINQCHVPELPNALFLRVPTLLSLEITDSHLETLHDYALNGLNHLQVLNLTRNNISIVKSWSDHDLEAVQMIDLRRNQLRELNKNTFRRFPNLTRLNLAVNFIEVLKENSFKYTLNLKYINLGKNLITSINEYTFKGLHKLTHLSLHQNLIRFIDFFAFVSNSHLKSLHLQGNQIAVFEAELVANLPRLTHLNLSHNQLEVLPEGTFKRNLELKILDLSFNNFTEFSETSFTGLESLEVFNVSNNRIDELNKYTFKEFTMVTHLVLANNYLTALEDELLEFVPHVRVFNASGNVITSIEDDLFDGLKELKVLDLSKNLLTGLNFLGSVVSKLKVLDIGGNLFHSVDLGVFEDVQHVVLEGNPWHCGWLIRAMMMKPDSIVFGRDYLVTATSHSGGIQRVAGIECVEEENGENRSVILLREVDKSPEDESGNFNNWHAPNSHSSGEHQAAVVLSQGIQPKTSIDDFDYKAIFLWLTIGIGVVFGVTKICRILLIKSERRSDELSREQHDKYMHELEEIDEKYMQQQMHEQHSIYKP
ncbi:insulin-like growth factor-binding protein complex acid labile subunit [Sergentomyia squamirostris]